MVYSDASGLGFGGYTVEHIPQIVHGQSGRPSKVPHKGKLKPFTQLCTKDSCPKLQNECLHWFTDNQNVVRIVLCGSKKLLLQELALSVFQLCVVHHVTIEPE